MSTPLYRHGDVLLQAVPLPAVPLQRQPHLTLAHGETTGHMHRIAEPGVAVLYRPDQPGREEQFLQVTAAHATLVHEEHHPLQLPTGWYRVWQQREYTPGRIRTVLD